MAARVATQDELLKTAPFKDSTDLESFVQLNYRESRSKQVQMVGKISERTVLQNRGDHKMNF